MQYESRCTRAFFDGDTSAQLPAGANRAQGYAVTASYFVGSAGILMWAIRRGGARSRLAYLIPLLVIGATLITVELIDRIL